MKDKWQGLRRISSLAKEHTFLSICALCILVCVLICIAFYVNYLCTIEYHLVANDKYTVAQFSDKAFEAGVRQYLRRPEGEIYSEELYGLNSLEIANQPQLTDMGDIRLFPNLSALTLSGCTIYDIAPIASLKYLKKLDLSQNLIKDISSICELNLLETLNVSNNNISQIPDGFKGLVNLIEFDISNNRVSNIENIIGSPNLQILYIRGNKLTDISGLGSVLSLNTADLGDNLISIITKSDVEKLESLILDKNCLTDIGFLQGLDNLKYIDLSYNDIKDISVLSTCANLESLTLYGENEFDLSPLHRLEKFNSIFLDENFDRKNIDFMIGHFKTGDRMTIFYLVSQKNMIESD